ncbi:MAG: tetratricopeptide repeat protein [Candidatus Sulfotelmatobacter sp.]
MGRQLLLLLVLIVPAFASEEKDQKKALEAQAKELILQAKDQEKSGNLLEGRKLYANSQAFWETKDAEKAIKKIDDEIHKQVKDAVKRAHQLYDSGKFQAATETLTKAQELGYMGAVISYDLALCYRQLGDSAMALGFLDEAILASVEPKRSAKLKQVRTIWTTGEQAATRKDLEKDHILYANQLIENIGFDASLADGTPTLDTDSEDADTPDAKLSQTALTQTLPQGRSHANTKAHRTASVCQALDQLKTPNGNAPSLMFDLANCAEANGHLKEASELLKQYVEAVPKATDADRVRQRIGDLDALLQLPEDTGPKVGSLYAAAARAMEERKYDRGLAEFQKAETIVREFAPTHWRLGVIYESMGNVTKAREYFTLYQQLATTPDAQSDALDHLNSLDTKKEAYDDEVDAAEETISNLLNRAMNLTFNGMEERAALYKTRQRMRQARYKNKKNKLKQVGGFGVPYAYAQQELSDASDHLATGMGLFPLGAEVNELVGIVYLQANDGRSAIRSFDAVSSQNLPVSFYAELRGHKKDHGVKVELTHDKMQMIFLSSYDKKGQPIPPDKNAGDDGLGDLTLDATEPRNSDFESLTVSPAEIKRVETKNGQLLLKLTKEDITLSPIYMPALVPTEGPQARRFANNYTRLFVRYPGLEDSKLGAEGLTVREKMKLAYDIANAGFNIATNLNPIGAASGAQAFLKISKEIHATSKSLHVNFAAWEKTVEDQNELRNGNTFKVIPTEAANLSFVEEIK